MRRDLHGQSARSKYLHFARPLVHVGVPRQVLKLAGSELQHPNISMLCRSDGFDNVDLALRKGRLRFDLLHKLK